MSYTPFGESEKPPHKSLNPEELQHLLNKLSSDEMKELQDSLKSCTSEVMMTRGVPITAAILGSLYFARTRLPSQYHFGPKGWPFYAVIGIGSMITTNMFYMSTCKERIQPRIDQLWQKYQSQDSSKMTYDYLRQQHRAGGPAFSSESQRSEHPHSAAIDQVRQQYRELTQRDQPQDTFIYGDRSTYQGYGSDTDAPSTAKKPFSYSQYTDEPSFISGTPSSSGANRDINRSEFS